MYLINNRKKVQIPVELCANPEADKVVCIPARAVRKVNCTDEEASFVRNKYGKTMIVSKAS